MFDPRIAPSHPIGIHHATITVELSQNKVKDPLDPRILPRSARNPLIVQKMCVDRDKHRIVPHELREVFVDHAILLLDCAAILWASSPL